MSPKSVETIVDADIVDIHSLTEGESLYCEKYGMPCKVFEIDDEVNPIRVYIEFPDKRDMNNYFSQKQLNTYGVKRMSQKPVSLDSFDTIKWGSPKKEVKKEDTSVSLGFVQKKAEESVNEEKPKKKRGVPKGYKRKTKAQKEAEAEAAKAKEEVQIKEYAIEDIKPNIDLSSLRSDIHTPQELESKGIELNLANTSLGAINLPLGDLLADLLKNVKLNINITISSGDS